MADYLGIDPNLSWISQHPIESSVGVSNIIKAMQFYQEGKQKKFKNALAGACKILLERSNYFVPWDKGDLIASARYKVSGQGRNAQGAVSYGGMSSTGRDVDYALWVHEDAPRHLRHGEEFNSFYAKQIASGKETPRRPQEKHHWLRDTSIDRGVQKEIFGHIKRVMEGTIGSIEPMEAYHPVSRG